MEPIEPIEPTESMEPIAASFPPRRSGRTRTEAGATAPLSGAAGADVTPVRRVAGEPTDDREALEVLRGLAEDHGPAGGIAPEALARHVLEVPPGADWPVRRAALEALLRRRDAARRDELRPHARPSDGPLGLYTTRRLGAGARPYTTRLGSVDPPRGSCDCPDFLGGSLGLCKHLLAILDALPRPAVGGRRSRPRRAAVGSAQPPAGPRLEWDPVRPLTGAGDPVDRIRLRGDGEAPAVRRHFDGTGRLRDAFAQDPGRRGALVSDLAAVADDPAVRT